MVKKLKNKLIQYKFYRDLVGGTYYFSTPRWKRIEEFQKGEQILRIDGDWRTQAFCSCGNELVHSQSFIEERYVKETKQYVYDYTCSFCGKKTYYNPDIMPGLMLCNKDGCL